MKQLVKKLKIPVKTIIDDTADNSYLKLSFRYDGIDNWTCQMSDEVMNDICDLVKNRIYPTNENSILSMEETHEDITETVDSGYIMQKNISEKIVKHMAKLDKHMHNINHIPTRRAVYDKLMEIYKILNNAEQYTV